MTTLRFTRVRRGATMLVAGLLASAAMVPFAGPALADPTPAPTSGPSVPGGTPTAPNAGSITWSVQPSTASGPDKRSSFIYNNLPPLTVIHDYVAVTNFSKNPVAFRIYASDAFNTASGSLDLLPAAEKPKDVGSWVKLFNENVTIPPGARVNEPFTLTIPADATPGDHTGGVIGSIQIATTTGVVVDRRVAVPILLRVSGKLSPAVAVESVTTTFHGVANPFGGGGTDIAYTVHNTGNSRITLDQAVKVTGPFGLSFGKATPASVADLLPGATIRVTAHIGGVFPAGPMGVHVTLTPSEMAGLPAGHAAPVAVTHDVGFWATPWPQLVLLLLLVGAFFLVRWLLQRNRTQTDIKVATAVAKAKRDTAVKLRSGLGSGAAEAGATTDTAVDTTVVGAGTGGDTDPAG